VRPTAPRFNRTKRDALKYSARGAVSSGACRVPTKSQIAVTSRQRLVVRGVLLFRYRGLDLADAAGAEDAAFVKHEPFCF